MKYALFILSLFFVESIFAQEAINQSKEISNLIESYRNYQKLMDVEDGYRIQISYTANREEAYQAKARLYKEFENIPSYVDYDQPNYKLRIGDFKTKLEATAFLQDVIKVYPSAFIVKDRIKIR
jgi:hypothetical protein